MAFFKRAMLSLIRRPFRAVILFLIITAIGVLELTGVFLSSTASELKDISLNKIGAQITLTGKNPLEAVDADAINKIMQDRRIIGYNATVSNLVVPVGFQNAVGSPKTAFAQEQDIDTSQVRVTGDLNVNMDDVFRNGQAQLISGTFPVEHDRGGVVDQTLAEKNHFKIGDSITVKYKGSDKEYTNDIRIVGIYKTFTALEESYTNTAGNTVYMQSPYSRIFTDLDTAKELFGDSSKVGTIDLYVDNVNHLNDVIKYMKTIPAVAGNYDIINSTDIEYSQVAGSIEMISHYSVMIVLAASLAGVFILFLVIVLWMRNYIYDTGVLIALGEKKSRIILQFLSEVLLITIVALIASVLIGMISSKYIGEKMIDYAAQSQYRNAITVIKPDPKLDLKASFIETLNWKTVLEFVGLGLLLVVVPTIGSCISIMRYKPRQVLNKAD